MSDAVVLNNKIIKDTHFCFLQFREYLPFQKDITLFFKQFGVFFPLGCFVPGLFKFGLVHGLREEGNTIKILQTNRQTDERSVQLMFN